MPTGRELAAAAPQYLGTPYSKMDCQKFVEQCLADIGIHKDLPGSNAWYREMDWVGSPEECRKQFGKVPVGAFLFIWEPTGEPEKYKGDGKGNASHIGIVTETGAIHSSASRGCVAESEFSGKTIKNGGWNKVGLWDRIDYCEEERPVETAIISAPDGGTVNLRDEPRKSGQRLMKMPTGSVVEVLSRGDEWSKVRFSGMTGFVMTEFLVTEPEDGDMIQVSRTELMEIYRKLGALIGE